MNDDHHSFDIMNEFRWGRQMDRCINALALYGGAAREFLPRLREVRQALTNPEEILALDKLMAAIEADPHPPTLQGVQEFIASQTKRPAQP